MSTATIFLFSLCFFVLLILAIGCVLIVNEVDQLKRKISYYDDYLVELEDSLIMFEKKIKELESNISDKE